MDFYLVTFLSAILFSFCAGFLYLVVLSKPIAKLPFLFVYAAIVTASYFLLEWLFSVWVVHYIHRYIFLDFLLSLVLLFIMKGTRHQKIWCFVIHLILSLFAYSVNELVVFNGFSTEVFTDASMVFDTVVAAQVLVYSIANLIIGVVFCLMYSKYKAWTDEKRIEMVVIMIPILEIVMLTFLAVLILSVGGSDSQFIMYGGVSIAVVVCIDILVFSTVRISKRVYHEEAEATHHAGMDAMKADYFELVKDQRKEISVIRHEVGNQIQLILNLLASGDENMADKAKALADELCAKIDATKGKRICKNNIVNAVLTVKVKQAAEQGIRTELRVNLNEDSRFEDFDLCSLFSNVFDNAVRAVSELPNADDRVVNLRVMTQGELVILKCFNKFLGEVKEKGSVFETTKEDKNRHGYGVGQIRSIVNKYNGDLQIVINDEEKTFTIQATMQPK